MRLAATAIAVGCALAIAGCGLGAGAGSSRVSLTVTRNFGAAGVTAVSAARVPGSETVMRMLERSARVQTRYGGGFVESINGLAGDAGRRDWFYYVNGIEASAGAATTRVHHGDRIWWDLHDWSATDSIPAVVGSFPEPFVHGIGGRRLPTALECASGLRAACQLVSSTLGAAGVPVASQYIGTGSGTDSLAVDVGTWNQLSGALVARLIEKGPSLSGIYARFVRGAGGAGAAVWLQLLDPRGAVVKTLGPGAGLVAATASNGSEPTWLVTGTDSAGVLAAARAFTAGRLRDHFALAVQGAAGFPVPVDGGA